MALTVAREFAYDSFIEVMERRRKPEEVLEDLYQTKAKSLRRLDRNFIHEIVYGGIRWFSKIYWILQQTADRNLDETTPQIRAALILGTYQIFYMDRVPDRAAVNESVEYVRQRGQANACSFVNGILRQIARKSEYFAKPDKEKESVAYLSLQFAHPSWMVRRWLKQFKFEKLEKILTANNEKPPYTVRINLMMTDTTKIHNLQHELLKEERTHSDKRNLRCALQLRESPNFERGSLFDRGFYTIQDEAAQLIAFLVDPRPGETIVDACAGPGGKLSHMYEYAQGKAHIIAVERSKIQFTRAQESMTRMKHTENLTWIAEDFLNWKADSGKVDRILLDAPCTGLGIIRRHPEAKWQKDEPSIGVLAKKQRELIHHALTQIKPGGQLTYSVCSFEPEETIDHVNWLKDEYEGKIELLTPITNLPDYFKRYVTRQNVLLIFPGNQDSMDGFGAFNVKVLTEIE